MMDGIFGEPSYEAAKRLLDVSVERHQTLAANLANINTPGYRRLDVTPSFEAELANAVRAGQVDEIGRLPVEIGEDQSVKTERPDGNNVRLDHELVEINRNALQYQMLTQKISGSLSRMKQAVTGRTSQ